MKWEIGEKGYINNSSLFVGLFVGVNPCIGSLVFFCDGKYKSYHSWQVCGRIKTHIGEDVG